MTETSIMAVAEDEAMEINYPEWTEYRKKNGLDGRGAMCWSRR